MWLLNRLWAPAFAGCTDLGDSHEVPNQLAPKRWPPTTHLSLVSEKSYLIGRLRIASRFGLSETIAPALRSSISRTLTRAGSQQPHARWPAQMHTPGRQERRRGRCKGTPRLLRRPSGRPPVGQGHPYGGPSSTNARLTAHTARVHGDSVERHTPIVPAPPITSGPVTKAPSDVVESAVIGSAVRGCGPSPPSEAAGQVHRQRLRAKSTVRGCGPSPQNDRGSGAPCQGRPPGR